MDEVIKKYSNGEVTVVWQPAKCIHSMVCWKLPGGLPEVFDPKARPWIDMDGASTIRIIEQVKKCPSGALSFKMEEGEEPVPYAEIEGSVNPAVVQAIANGPLMIYGNIIVKDATGNETQKINVTAFCRCGASKHNPYCDGTHADIHFKG